MSCNSVYMDGPEGVIETPTREESDLKILPMDKYVKEYQIQVLNRITSCQLKKDTHKGFFNTLPPEIFVQCMTYLHPKDILTLSCCDKIAHSMVHEEYNSAGMSSMIWFSLFQRDYVQVLTEYQYGQDAVQRSLRDGNICCPKAIQHHVLMIHKTEYLANDQITDYSLIKMKDFYFLFGQTWQSYIIAGRTQNPTLVGIHGHIFDMTPFLEDHPGSPETIIMQGGGKDATRLFESVGHSTLARKIGIHNILQVVDTSCYANKDNHLFGCRVLTLGQTVTHTKGALPGVRSKPNVPGTISAVRTMLIDDKARADVMLRRQMSKQVDVNQWSHLNVFFDPICNTWKGWYLNSEFEPVYITS